MKRILVTSLAVLAFATTSFGATLASNDVTAGGYAVRGGSTQGNAQNAQTPMIKFSTGVSGLVNFVEDNANPGKSTGYVIAARHTTGSKNFLAVNDKNNIYWKQATPVTSSVTISQAMKADIPNQVWDAFVFQGTGWTSY